MGEKVFTTYGLIRLALRGAFVPKESLVEYQLKLEEEVANLRSEWE